MIDLKNWQRYTKAIASGLVALIVLGFTVLTGEGISLENEAALTVLVTGVISTIAVYFFPNK